MRKVSNEFYRVLARPYENLTKSYRIVHKSTGDLRNEPREESIKKSCASMLESLMLRQLFKYSFSTITEVLASPGESLRRLNEY